MVDNEVVNMEAFTQQVKADFLNFNPQGVADFAASALLARARSMLYTFTLAAAHLRQTCQLPNIG